MFNLAYAMGGAPPGEGGGAAGGGFAAFIPLVVIVLIFYFLLIRPQQKRQKQHRQFLSNLKRGDIVVTTGGLHGKITGLTDMVVTLEIAENFRVKVSRSYIAGSVPGHKES